MTDDLISRARELAHRAHAVQVDKAGRPYIEHVARVAAAVRSDGRCSNDDCCRGEIIDYDSVGCSDPSCCSPATYSCAICDEAEAVAWLHDVFEDCRHTPEWMEAMEFQPSQVAVNALHLSREVLKDDAHYYENIRRHPIAMRVKLADIADNADESRLALLDEKTAARLRRKYAKALESLTGESNAR